jgi:hypothetical protein
VSLLNEPTTQPVWYAHFGLVNATKTTKHQCIKSLSNIQQAYSIRLVL